MPMKITTGIVVVIALIVTVFLFMFSGTLFNQQEMPRTASDGSNMNLYANGTYGISFAYPETYVVSEGERGTPERPHYAIVLTHQDDVDVPIGGEGPPTITVDVYQGVGGKTLSTWLHTTPESNLSLGNGSLEDMSVGDIPALFYEWSGLYEGKSVALLHDDSVIVVSVTYLTREDAIIQDFEKVLEGLNLSN